MTDLKPSRNKYIIVHTPQYYCISYVIDYWQESNTQKHNTTAGSGLKWKRCGLCEGCLAKDCMICKFCRDKKKYGGPGKLKQCCVKKKCTMNVQEAKSKLPQIFQQSMSTNPSKLLHQNSFLVYF